MTSAQDVWNRVLEIMSDKLTSTAIDTWFSDTAAVEVGDGRLVIYCPSNFKKEVIETRFLQHLQDALYELFSGEFGLLMLGEGELEPYLGKQEQSTQPLSDERMDLTFDRFVVGSNNKFAHAAAKAVAEKPAVAYNPLFIYGNSGLGKTHLLHAIRHAAKQLTDLNVVYTKGDQFTNELITSIQAGKMEEFRMKHRSAQFLLMDDVQFIAGKESTQEEFFHTFNTLYESDCQIVLTSDRPPRDILRLEDRLQSRFEWGLIADVGPPDYETRMAIIRNKALQLGLVLPDDIAHTIAEHFKSNIRQLEGSVKMLTAYGELLGAEIDNKEVALRTIEDMLHKEFLPTPEIIIQETARFYRLTADDIRGNGRTRDTALARQVSMYLIRKLTDLSLINIGREYKGKSGSGMDHSSVLNAIQKIETLIEEKPEFKDTIRDIQNNITERN